jgi:hypothetical protein
MWASGVPAMAVVATPNHLVPPVQDDLGGPQTARRPVCGPPHLQGDRR